MSRRTGANITSSICTEGRCLRRRDADVAGEEHSADELRKKIRGDVPSKNWELGRSYLFPVITYQDV